MTDKKPEETGLDEWGNTPSSDGETLPPAESTPASEPEPAPQPPSEPLAEPTTPALDVTPITEAISKGFETLQEKWAVKDQEDTKPEEPPAWKPEKWDDFSNLAEERAKTVYTQMRDQEKAEEERIKAEAKAEEERINGAFDGMVADLEKEGMLPPVQDESNADDPGRKARAELYAYSASVGTLDLKAAGSQLKELHDSGFSFDPDSKKLLRSNPKPTGADAPVGSSSRTTGPARRRLDIHSASWDDLTRRAKEEFYR